ncbi:MAG: zinc-dependent metalloprotease, partial [Bacteroidota bacterium]
KETFSTPSWMLNEEVLSKIEGAGTIERIRRAQTGTLNQLLDPGRLARLIEAEAKIGSKTYTAPEMMSDLRTGIWSELRSGRKIDVYRRNLQRGYIEKMHSLMTDEQRSTPVARRGFTSGTRINVNQSDIRPLVRAELKTLKSRIRSGLARTSDRMTRYHLEDAIERIDMILDPNG